MVIDEVREALAALAHEQWSAWMRYQFRRQLVGGVMTRDDSTRWRRQMTTPYAELPESEKESDRKEADRVLALVVARLQSLEAENARLETVRRDALAFIEAVEVSNTIDEMDGDANDAAITQSNRHIALRKSLAACNEEATNGTV